MCLCTTASQGQGCRPKHHRSTPGAHRQQDKMRKNGLLGSPTVPGRGHATTATTTTRPTVSMGHTELGSRLPTGKQSLDLESTQMGGERTDSKHLSRQEALHRCSHEDGRERDRTPDKTGPLHGARAPGLTHRFTHSHTIILRLKIVPVASAAAIYKVHALSLGEVEVPTRHHGPAGPRHRLLGADSCVETVRM